MLDADLLPLTANRWAIPVLAHLRRQSGARFSVLLASLKPPRSSLAATLDLLIAQGLVCRNPGYGHPLRPEYLLTPVGCAVAGRCDRIVAAGEALNLGPIGRWELPVIDRLGHDRAGFTALQRSLTPITPRALQLCLDRMRRRELVDRTGLPQRPIYQLEAAGWRMFDALSG